MSAGYDIVADMVNGKNDNQEEEMEQLYILDNPGKHESCTCSRREMEQAVEACNPDFYASRLHGVLKDGGECWIKSKIGGVTYSRIVHTDFW